jgi:hypothetical protein
MLYNLLIQNQELASVLTSFTDSKSIPSVIEKMDGTSLVLNTEPLSLASYFCKQKLVNLIESNTFFPGNRIKNHLTEAERNRSVGIFKDLNTDAKEISIKKLQPGDTIVAIKMKGTYLHYGIYVGNREVIHFSYLKEENFFDKDTHVRIVKTSYEDFSNGSQTYREPLRRDMNFNSGRKTAKIAKSMVDNDFGGYNLATNNCEHFANYCRYNEKVSFQIKDLADKGWFDPSRSMIIEHYLTNNVLIPQKYEKINYEPRF